MSRIPDFKEEGRLTLGGSCKLVVDLEGILACNAFPDPTTNAGWFVLI